jgi:hypothetical protein
VINAIALKMLCPEVTVVLLDGEEVGGLGSEQLAEQINAGEFGEIEWVLNLELTGVGIDVIILGRTQNNLQANSQCIDTFKPCGLELQLIRLQSQLKSGKYVGCSAGQR